MTCNPRNETPDIHPLRAPNNRYMSMNRCNQRSPHAGSSASLEGEPRVDHARVDDLPYPPRPCGAGRPREGLPNAT